MEVPPLTLWRRFAQPYYVLRPGTVARRLRSGPAKREVELMELPWGPRISVRPTESVGRTILRNGVFDLALTEALLRLVEPGDLAVDVGANIGYMASAMAHAGGREGRVLALEAHPSVFVELRQNAARWSGDPALAPLGCRNLAVSDVDGEVTLATNETFADNRGSATVVGDQGGGGGWSTLQVEAARLDDLVGAGERPGVLKIDVEGHEEAVLRGASALLTAQRVRDVVFEEHGSYPTASSDLLEDAGYTVFRLSRTFFGPLLTPPGQTSGLEADPSLIATTQPARLHRLLAPRGWVALGLPPRTLSAPRRRRAPAGATPPPAR